MYQRMEFPYIVPQEATIHIFFGPMDSLTSIFLRRLPPRDIDTIEKVFKEAIAFNRGIWLGIVNALARNGVMATILFKVKEDTKFSPPWGSTYFMNVTTSLKTFSMVSISLGGSLLRKIEFNDLLFPNRSRWQPLVVQCKETPLFDTSHKSDD